MKYPKAKQPATNYATQSLYGTTPAKCHASKKLYGFYHPERAGRSECKVWRNPACVKVG